MHIYRLSTAAAADIDGIFEYGIETYGLNLATIYLSGLSGAIEMLCAHPKLGRSADNLAKELRRLEYKSHIVFYRLDPKCIHIVRVIHKQMDIDDQVKDWFTNPVDRISEEIYAYG